MDYEARYRELKSTGHAGWGGDHVERNLARLKVDLDRLRRGGFLPEPPARVLEIGCGNGMSSFLLAQDGYDVHGIDISETAIAWAQERFAEAGLAGSFVTGDVRDMTCLADDSFDFVFDGSCLHCLIRDDRGRCLNEVSRILRHDGVFVVSTMCGLPRSDEAREHFDPKAACLMRNGRPYRTLKLVQQIEDELAGSGFRVVDVRVRENPWWDHAVIVCRGG